MQTHNQREILRPAAELVLWPAGQALLEGTAVYIQDEDAIKQVNEAAEVPRPPTEQLDRAAIAGEKTPYLSLAPSRVRRPPSGTRR